MANPVSLNNGYRLYIDNTSPSRDGNGYSIKCTLRKTGSWGSYGNYSTDWWIEIDGVRHSGTLSSFSDSTSTIGTYTRTVPVTVGAAAETITIKGYWNSEHSSVGSGSPSDTVSLPRIPYPDPSTPAAPSVSSSSAGQFTASWSKPSGTVSKYRVAYRVNSGGWTFVETTSTSYSKTGLTPGATIGVEIKALNADGESPYSSEGKATMDAEAPSAPGTPTVTSGAAGSFTATWSAPSDDGGKSITSYDLRYRVNGGAWVTVTGASSGYTKTGLTPGASIGVQVLAKNPDASSAYSTERTVTMDAAAPSTPAAPKVTSSAPGEFTATWSAPSSNGGKSITSYDLRYQVNGGSWVTVSGASSGYTKAGLTPGGALNVQVLARNVDAASAYSASGSVDMLAGGRVKASGAWGDAVTWVRMDGVYVKCRVWVKAGGVWAPYR